MISYREIKVEEKQQLKELIDIVLVNLERKEILNINSNKIAEFGGYLVLKEYRNRGIMKHLEDMLISKLKEMNYEYAVITVHPDNIASNKVIEYTGAKIVKTTNFGDYLRNIYLLKI